MAVCAWLEVLLFLFLACHNKLGYLRAMTTASYDTWSFTDLSKNMEKHGAAKNSKSPVGDGLYLDGSEGTYVELKGHDENCLKDPCNCDISIGFFFKYRLQHHTNSEIFFGNKDDNDNETYQGINIIYKHGIIRVLVYGKDRYCTYSTHRVHYGVWNYIGLIWETTGNLTFYRDEWVDRAFLCKWCGPSPCRLRTRNEYYLGRRTFPIAYYKDLNIWYFKQNKSVLDANWQKAFDNGNMTELTLKIISDLAFYATKVEQWIANFTATVQQLFNASGDAKFKEIRNVSISDSDGNSSISFKLKFQKVFWPSILTLQLALENGRFLGSHGIFDEAACIGEDNFVCQVPKNHTAYVIDHNCIDIRMDPVVGEDENCLYGYHVLFKNLDDPNSVWVANEIHRRNPPGRVRIPRLRPYTNYSFRVVARSFKSGGLISEAIQAKTDEWVPSVGPEIVANISTNSTAIYVQWNRTIPPDKVHGILIGYNVSWDDVVFPPGDPHDSKGSKDVGLSATNYTITGLYEYWLYKVWVSGRTSVGNGTATERAIITLEDVPSDSPANIHLIMVNSSSLQASWEEVPLFHQNGIILGYRVQLQQADSAQVVENTTVGSSVKFFYFTGLMIFQEYSVEVAAFTRKGEGPLNNKKVNQMTDEAVPINSPDSLAAHNVSSSVVQVNWNYHEDPRLTLGHLLGFTLYLREANASDVFTAGGSRPLPNDRGLVNSTQITGLKIYRLYNITIAARTNKGAGPTNESVIVRTDGEAPGAPPQSLTAHNKTNSSLYASWQEVVLEKHHGIMQGYKISIHQMTKQGFQRLENQTYELSVLQAHFTGLKPITKYKIEVLGFNNFGDGPSKSLEVFTEESNPSKPPSNFTAVNESSTILFAFWKDVPECCQRGIILGYHVTLIDSSNASIAETLTTSDLFQSFHNLKKYHGYNLTVEAFTSKGAGPKAFTSVTTDQDVPEAPPQNVTGYNISQSEIFVFWAPVPIDKVNGILTEYSIRYLEAGKNNSKQKVFNASVSKGVVDGLKPFTTYSLNVSASTIKGQGPFSIAIQVKTEEEAPKGTPSKFEGFNSSSTSIKLSWDPIPQGHVAGVLRQFYITYRQLNTSVNNTRTIAVPITNLSFELKNLRKYTTYRLEIKAATKFPGKPTAPIHITTDEDIPSLPPQDIKIQNSSATSLSLQWNPIPKDFVHGILLGIKLQYRAATRDNSILFRSRARRAVEEGWYEYKTINLPPNQLAHKLTSLKNFTNYSIVMFGFTSKGDGNVSHQFVVSTDENVPSKPPPEFQPRSRSGDYQMDATWDPVPDGYVHGILRGYRIYFTKTREVGRATSEQTERNITVGPNVFNKTITLLSNFATYNLEITAFTIKGEGPRSAVKNDSTCNCPRVFKTSWYHFPPYISYDDGIIGGFIPQIFENAIEACCSDCTLPDGKSASKIDYEFDGKGNPGRKPGVKELISSIDSDTDFSVPMNGYEGQTHYSLYRYVKFAESPGVAFITVMDPAEKADAMANVFLHSWPLLLLLFSMMVVAGIVMWSLDTQTNTNEFPKSFVRGAYEGIWWAFVTSTTVGYGDRCPKGVVARLVAILWTFCGLVIITILTSKIATALTEFGYSGPYITLYGTQVAAISNNSGFRLGIRKNAKVNTVRSYKTYEEISQALANQEVKGALVDLYVLSSHKHLFQDPRFRIVRIYDYKTSYGVVLAGNSMKLETCFTEQIKSDAGNVFQSIEDNVKILKEPEDSPGEQQSTELFSATSPKFITTVIIIGTLLIVSSVVGIIYELRRDKTSEDLMQSKDLRNEMHPIVETFVANMKKKVEVLTKRHHRQQCRVIRAEKERNQQAAMVLNQYYDVLSSRDIRQDWYPKRNVVQRSNSDDPTAWPFSAHKLASPPKRTRQRQGSYNVSVPVTMEPTVRIIEDTRL